MRFSRDTGGQVNARRRKKGIDNRERVYRLLLNERLDVDEIMKKTCLGRSVVNSCISRLIATGRVYIVCYCKTAGTPRKVYTSRFIVASSLARPSSVAYAGRQEIRGYLWTDGAFL